MLWTTVPDLAKEGHISTEKLYELSRRKHDPFPVRYIDGSRYGQVLISEADEWVRRNGVLMNERSADD